MNRYLYRIVTFMGHPSLPASPKTMLMGGNRTVTIGDKRRVFVVRQVFYDGSMTPIYTVPEPMENRYESLQELKESNPNYEPLFDTPILDWDNYLKIWNDENI